MTAADRTFECIHLLDFKALLTLNTDVILKLPDHLIILLFQYLVWQKSRDKEGESGGECEKVRV